MMTAERVMDASQIDVPKAADRAAFSIARALLAETCRGAGARSPREVAERYRMVAIAARDDRPGLSDLERLFVWFARG